MPEPKRLSDDLSVCAFVPPDQLAALAGKFRTIINHRRDGEEPGQPSSAEIEAAARQLGLDYVHIPVVPGQVSDQQVAEFARVISSKPGPVLAFCKTGTRAATLWALSQAGKRSADEILGAARAAGYDLGALGPRLGADTAAS